jgi:hypothetical protein
MFLETLDPKDRVADQDKHRIVPTKSKVQYNLEFHVLYSKYSKEQAMRSTVSPEAHP